MASMSVRHSTRLIAQPLSPIRAQHILANHLFVVPVGDAHLQELHFEGNTKPLRIESRQLRGVQFNT
jgi:hypothetical protein